MKTIKYIVSALFVVPFFAGCGVQQRCTDPQLELPTTLDGDSIVDSLCMADIKWWEFYADSTLQQLIKTTLENNKDMLSAAARVREMNHRTHMAKADLLPSFSAPIYANRETNDYDGEKFINDPEIAVKARVSWEIDFFGRLRWSKRAAMANYLASVEAQRSMQMTLIAEVATAYFELLALDRELEIVRHTLNTRKENVHQAYIRFHGGLTSEITYQQAQVELASTASLIPELERRIRIKENEIALLSGRFPQSIERMPIKTKKLTEDELKAGLPSDLLLRRPDIRRAEQSLRAAMASAGIAWADRFPKVTFGFTGGFENNDFAGLFSSPFSFIVGDMSSPLFAFGKRKARYEAAIDAYDNARYQYEETVLRAFKEVSDACITLKSAQKTHILMQDLEKAAKKNIDLVLFQHINGDIRYIDVLDAQRRYFSAELEVIDAELEERLAIVTLYKALGGGW